jgi:excinuclease ABC subunit C
MVPAHLSKLIKSLPDSPGVYKYFDAEDVIIYVGEGQKPQKARHELFHQTAARESQNGNFGQ